MRSLQFSKIINNEIFRFAFSFLRVATQLFCYPLKNVYRRYRLYFWLLTILFCLYLYKVLTPDLPPDISSDRTMIFYPERDTIKIVSLSLGCGYYGFGGTQACKKKVLSFKESVLDYDIILIQEVYMFHIGPFYSIENVLFLNREMFLQGYLYRTTSRDTMKYLFMSRSNGLASFSRLPICSSNSTVFHCSNLLNYPSDQGFEISHISLKIPNASSDDLTFLIDDGKPRTYRERSLFLLNVHLGTTASTRTCQLEELLVRLVRLPSDSFIVISGNLNIDPIHWDFNEYERLRKMMGFAGLSEAYNHTKATHRDGSHYDYVFVSKNIKVLANDVRRLRHAKGEPISDHFGLFMNLQLLDQESNPVRYINTVL